MIKLRSYIFLFFLLCFFFTVQAQDKWLNFTNNYYVTDVIESDQGLWIASHGGLCFVDATTEIESYYNRGNSGIPSNAINDLLMHPDGTLWITTASGICTLKDQAFEKGNSKLRGIMRLTPDDKIIVANYDSLYIQTDGLEFEQIAYPSYSAGIGGIEIDQEGTIYYNAINYFSETYVAVYKNNTWEIVKSNYEYETSLVMDSNEKIWFLNSEGLQIYEDELWNVVVELDSLDALSAGKIHVDINDNILIEIRSACPTLVQWNGEDLQEISFVKGNCTDVRFVKPSTDKTDTYYSSNTKEGFYQFSHTDINDFQQYTQSPIYNNSPITSLHPSNGRHYVIFSDYIQQIHHDVWSRISIPTELSSNIIYAGLKSDQLWICDKESLWFREGNSWNKFNLPSNISGNIQFMTIGANGDIWIQSGLTIAQYKDDSWEFFTSGQHDITSSIIQDMLVDPTNGDLWVSTFQGVRQYDGNIWTTYNFPPVNHTFSLAIAETGVFVRKAGMYQIKEDVIDSIPMPEIGYYGPFESEMTYDLQGQQLFLSGTDLLAVYKNGDWLVYSTDDSPIYNGFSNDINLDTKDNLWLCGSGGGLEIFNDQGIVLAEDNSTSIHELALHIYPTISPSNHVFIETPISGSYQVILCNKEGRIMQEDTVELHSNETFSYVLPISIPGTYFLTCRFENKSITKKVVRIGY